MNTNNIIVILVILLVSVGIAYLLVVNTKNTRMMDDKHHINETVKEYEIRPGIVSNKIENGEDIILLDVRTVEEYEKVHLKNSVLLPVQELSAESLEKIGLGEDAKDKEIIIYCRSGVRSKTAYDIMNSLGYTNIKSMSGGMIHWKEDQYPFIERAHNKGE